MRINWFVGEIWHESTEYFLKLKTIYFSSIEDIKKLISHKKRSTGFSKYFSMHTIHFKVFAIYITSEAGQKVISWEGPTKSKKKFKNSPKY